MRSKSLVRIRANSKFPTKEIKTIIEEVAKEHNLPPHVLEMMIRSEFLFVENTIREQKRQNIFLSGFGRFLYDSRWEDRLEKAKKTTQMIKERYEKKKAHIHSSEHIDGHQDSEGKREADNNQGRCEEETGNIS